MIASNTAWHMQSVNNPAPIPSSHPSSSEPSLLSTITNTIKTRLPSFTSEQAAAATPPGPAEPSGSNPPEQVRLTPGASSESMVMTWVCSVGGESMRSAVWVGVVQEHGVQWRETVTVSETPPRRYTVRQYTSGWLHAVRVDELEPGRQYAYAVGSADELGAVADWSRVFMFRTPRVLVEEPGEPLVFGVVGDPGLTKHSARVLQAMVANKDKWHAYLCPGDAAYADGHHELWDAWGRMVEPLWATVPSLLGTGNHERWDEFIAYRNRFVLPSPPGGDNFFWATNIGGVHVIGLDSERQRDEWAAGSAQMEWLETYLDKIDHGLEPWIIVLVHQPVHSNKAHRNRLYPEFMRLYEPIFSRHRVNLVISGHVHAYERTHRILRGRVNRRGGIMYLTVGTGGNRFGLSRKWVLPAPERTAFRTAEHYGFATVHIHNATSLQVQFHGLLEPTHEAEEQALLELKLVDEVWINNY